MASVRLNFTPSSGYADSGVVRRSGHAWLATASGTTNVANQVRIYRWKGAGWSLTGIVNVPALPSIREGGFVTAVSLTRSGTPDFTLNTWLDDPPNLSCKDSTRQHAVDGPRLSCNLLPCQERRTTLRPSPRCPAAASAWSLDKAEELGRPTALSQSPGAGLGGRPTAAVTGSRPAKATGRSRMRAAAPPPKPRGGSSRRAPKWRYTRPPCRSTSSLSWVAPGGSALSRGAASRTALPTRMKGSWQEQCRAGGRFCNRNQRGDRNAG
jgi:hypothetical protein